MSGINIRLRCAVWFQAVRAPFFTAAVIPVFLVFVYALWVKLPVTWFILPLAVMGMIFLHAGTNCINDYYDFKNGIDKKTTFGSSRVLVDGLMSPRHIFIESIILFSLGAAIGLVIVASRGPVILGIGLVGMAGGYFYSAKPLGLKYLAWGDMMVFLLFGPFLAWGASYALTGTHGTAVILVSIPLGLLVTGILHANNIRDMRDDRSAGIKTMALLLGLKKSQIAYSLLLSGAYAGILVMTSARILPWQSLAVFLSLPLAVNNMTIINNVKEDNLKSIAKMDVQTAQLHLLFGLLLIFSIGWAGIFR
ncbi:MAG: 1,4-dihydroxy-2-naphthoate octaprenyltransferase [Candidatus Omnitrophota bacterium]